MGEHVRFDEYLVFRNLNIEFHLISEVNRVKLTGHGNFDVILIFLIKIHYHNGL